MEKKIKKVHLVFSLILGLLVLVELIYLFTLKPFYFPFDLPQLQPQSVEEEMIEKKISQMSLEEKVGALFVVGFSGQTLTDATEEFINSHHFRHFLLLGRNISNPEQLKTLTHDLDVKTGSLHGLIAIDQEGGQVARIQFEEIDNTSQAEIASNAQAYKVGRNRGEVLKDLGINLNLSPVVEVIREEDSYLDRLGRSFPGNEEQVFLLSKAMIQGYQEAGLIPFSKHFPGSLGRKSIDPHQDLPVLEINRAQLNQDLLPLAQLIKQGKISTLMSTHILYPHIDANNPVTTSEKFISAILRGDLHFKGVLISDDLIMRGISSDRTVEQAAVAAFNAGHDLLIISGPSQAQDRVYQSLLEAVKRGEISEERIDESLRRLLRLESRE